MDEVHKRIEEINKHKDEILKFLHDSLIEDKHNIEKANRDINELYNNEHIKQLIIRNSSNAFDAIAKLKYGYLNNYIEIISTIFSDMQRLEQLNKLLPN